MRLKDKVGIITGAGSGMGRETALLFAREGAKVIAADMNKESAEETSKLIKQSGGEAFAIGADVTKEEDVKSMVALAVNKCGKLDILFNNAGYPGKPGFDGMTLDEWDKIIAVNLTGVYLGAKHAIPIMQKQKKGSIISTSSGAGIVGSITRPAYSAAKGGVVLLTQSLALALAKDNVRVNVICPGPTETPMLSEFLKSATVTIEKMREGYLAAIPMGRFTKATDIANAALFLASDESSFITGVWLPVDGGFLAY